jgi:aminotransferase
MHKKLLEESSNDFATNLLEAVKKDSSITQMHYGSPSENILENIEIDFDKKTLLKESKTYYQQQGCIQLRRKIAELYKDKYNVNINPSDEIIITNGCTEALNLAIRASTQINDNILITNPTYQAFDKIIIQNDRNLKQYKRSHLDNEYQGIENFNEKISAVIINSPENPTGYCLSLEDWKAINTLRKKNDAFLIHDEILSELSYERKHIPAMFFDKDKTILVNGFSKSYGVPGIRIGWMVANKNIIKKATEIHGLLYLAISSISQYIAFQILNNKNSKFWIENYKKKIVSRTLNAIERLSNTQLYRFDKKYFGGLTFIANIDNLYKIIPGKFKNLNLSKGESVANFLLVECKVTVTPCQMYGSALENYIKIINCNDNNEFKRGLEKLLSVEKYVLQD